ncbi:MAG: hypothetical protein LBM71_00155 [Elusimicrobiota bacterium]|jgi:hypothetical protein|nr:hypothetical protein [Elusimicrobiota bacterium]
MEKYTYINEQLIDNVRNQVKHMMEQKTLEINSDKWNMLCIALDTLEDMTLSIKYYIKTQFPRNDGGKYLYIFGLFQSLFVQQDAIKAIYKALLNKEIDFKKFPYLNNIRNIRNDVVGHSTGRGTSKNTPKRFMSISRTTMDKESFEYYTYFAQTATIERHEINVVKIINDQNKTINMMLENIIYPKPQKLLSV